MLLLALLWLVQLNLEDVQRLVRYETVAPQESAVAIEQVRADFRGRAAEIARHFLSDPGYPPSTNGYGFVLKALADKPSTLLLIASLINPPQSSGPLPRYEGEIEAVLTTIFENEIIRDDPEISAALQSAVQAGSDRAADAALRLLGLSRAPEAIRALERFAVELPSKLRTHALEAMGEHQTPATLNVLLTVLRTDADTANRVRAANALARLGMRDAAGALQEALRTEQAPEVVDAIVSALNGLGMPIAGAELAEEILRRCWQPAPCASLFSTWTATAGDADMMSAATAGAPVLRVLSIQYLLGDLPSSRSSIVRQPFVLSPARNIDPAVQERILASLIDLLSSSTEMSDITRWTAEDLIWDAAGHNMSAALREADLITPIKRRFDAASRLASKDPAAYNAHRRRQAGHALIAAVPFVLLSFIPGVRRAALLIAFGIMGWALWIVFVAGGVRELPPPPLPWLTASFIGFACAGFICAVAAMVHARRGAGPAGTTVQAFISIAASATVAFCVCAWTRAYRYFPMGPEAWELLFEPIGAAMVAAIVAFLLSVVAFLMRPKTSSI